MLALCAAAETGAATDSFAGDRFQRRDGGAETGTSPADAEEITLVVGGQPADKASQRYIARSGLDFAGTIWESSVQRLIDGTLDELSGG